MTCFFFRASLFLIGKSFQISSSSNLIFFIHITPFFFYIIVSKNSGSPTSGSQSPGSTVVDPVCVVFAAPPPQKLLMWMHEAPFCSRVMRGHAVITSRRRSKANSPVCSHVCLLSWSSLSSISLAAINSNTKPTRCHRHLCQGVHV